MRLNRTVLTILGFWFLAGQNPAVGLQEASNVQLGVDNGGVASGQPNNTILPPPTLAGIPCKQIKVGGATKCLPESVLLDQNGRKIRFYTDLIKGKTVLISFFFTTCSSTCSRQGRVFSDLQNELGNRLGRDIFLISVSMDPETDTPERLKSWGKQYGVRKGWTLLTGGKIDMEKLVGHLTGNPLGRIQTHAPFIYLGNDKKDHWTATYGLAALKVLVKQIEEL